MPILEVAIPVRDDQYTPPWPLPAPPYPAALRLHAGMSAEELGLAVAAIADRNSISLDGSAHAAMERIAEESPFGMSGGVQARDGERVIATSCCAGLDMWRQWEDLAAGGDEGMLWLRHDPWPWVERTPEGYRVWSDGGGPPYDAAPFALDFAVGELEAAVVTVQQDLSDFLNVLATWATALAPNAATAFTAAIDDSFTISSASTRRDYHG